MNARAQFRSPCFELQEVLRYLNRHTIRCMYMVEIVQEVQSRLSSIYVILVSQENSRKLNFAEMEKNGPRFLCSICIWNFLGEIHRLNS